jgi:hypothetical protein
MLRCLRRGCRSRVRRIALLAHRCVAARVLWRLTCWACMRWLVAWAPTGVWLRVSLQLRSVAWVHLRSSRCSTTGHLKRLRLAGQPHGHAHATCAQAIGTLRSAATTVTLLQHRLLWRIVRSEGCRAIGCALMVALSIRLGLVIPLLLVPIALLAVEPMIPLLTMLRLLLLLLLLLLIALPSLVALICVCVDLAMVAAFALLLWRLLPTPGLLTGVPRRRSRLVMRLILMRLLVLPRELMLRCIAPVIAGVVRLLRAPVIDDWWSACDPMCLLRAC